MSQHLTPMLACAQAITIQILASLGRKWTPMPGGDPVARWAFAAFRFVDDPGMLRSPPEELLQLGQRAERGKATPQEKMILDVCSLPLHVWTRVSDALSSTPDPEGDGTPGEHDAERAKRVNAWETTSKAKALASIEAALAELVPRVVERALLPR